MTFVPSQQLDQDACFAATATTAPSMTHHHRHNDLRTTATTAAAQQQLPPHLLPSAGVSPPPMSLLGLMAPTFQANTTASPALLFAGQPPAADRPIFPPGLLMAEEPRSLQEILNMALLDLEEEDNDHDDHHGLFGTPTLSRLQQ